MKKIFNSFFSLTLFKIRLKKEDFHKKKLFICFTLSLSLSLSLSLALVNEQKLELLYCLI
jgi:hypothetical protein